MTRAVILYTYPAAMSFAAKIDALTGCPSPSGGTLQYAELLMHPDGMRWAYPVDATVAGLLPIVAPTAAVVELDATWFPEPLDMP